MSEFRARLPPRPSDEAIDKAERTAGALAAGAFTAGLSALIGHGLAAVHDALDISDEIGDAAERAGVSRLDIAFGLVTGDLSADDFGEGYVDAEIIDDDNAPRDNDAPRGAGARGAAPRTLPPRGYEAPTLALPPPPSAKPATATTRTSSRKAERNENVGVEDDDLPSWASLERQARRRRRR